MLLGPVLNILGQDLIVSVLDSPEYLAKSVALDGFLDTLNVVPLQEFGLGLLDISGCTKLGSEIWLTIEAVDLKLVVVGLRGVWVIELRHQVHQLLQVVCLHVDINVNEASLVLLGLQSKLAGLRNYLEVFHELLEVGGELEGYLVLLQVFFEQVLQHLVILEQEYFDRALKVVVNCSHAGVFILEVGRGRVLVEGCPYIALLLRHVF